MQRPARRPPHQSRLLRPVNRAVIGTLSYVGLRMRRSGLEHLEVDGPLLIACNHVSFVDPLVVGAAALPRLPWFMAKEELFRGKILGRWVHGSGGFPVRRATPDFWAVRTARELLARGECLLVFPEGGVTRSGHMRPGFNGAGYLAMQPEVTVVPAIIWNTQLLRGPARVRFGPPIPMDDLRASPRAGRNRRATDRIMATIAAMLPQVGGPVQDPPVGTPWLPPPRGKGSIRS